MSLFALVLNVEFRQVVPVKCRDGKIRTLALVEKSDLARLKNNPVVWHQGQGKAALPEWFKRDSGEMLASIAGVDMAEPDDPLTPENEVLPVVE